MPRQITIDKSGRLVIPKDIRERHRLEAGSTLTLTEEEGRLVLVPHSQEPTLLERDGLLVVGGPSLDTIPDHRSLREERLDHLSRFE